MIDIFLNGTPHRIEGTRLADLLAQQAINPAERGIAIALNDGILPRASWQTTELTAGDAVEIVRPHSGG